LLFDEPLSNLDARLRLAMRGEIKQLQKRLGITTIYVTHDQVEAMTMADRIAVMNRGKLEAFDTPEELYDRPKTLFIANFVGNPPMNLIEVNITASNGTLMAQNGSFHLNVSNERGEKAAAHGGPVILGTRAEDITIADDGEVEGTVFVVEPLGRDDMLDVRVDDQSFLVLADPAAKIRAEDRIKLHINIEALQFFDPVSEKTLLWS
jgi:ABC-type sugar transport system ATPase subunit